MDLFLIISSVIGGYIIFLFIMKGMGLGRKKICENCNNCCPICQAPLNRIQRTSYDHLLNQFTFKIFDSKRYICSNCAWEGLRWEDRFSPR